MELPEAKSLLDRCIREGVSDAVCGDSEIGWWLSGKQVAEGYFSGQDAKVVILDHNLTFTGDDATELRYCGTMRGSTRDDESPDNEDSAGGGRHNIPHGSHDMSDGEFRVADARDWGSMMLEFAP